VSDLDQEAKEHIDFLEQYALALEVDLELAKQDNLSLRQELNLMYKDRNYSP